VLGSGATKFWTKNTFFLPGIPFLNKYSKALLVHLTISKKEKALLNQKKQKRSSEFKVKKKERRIQR
jgi:hypothetical protein